MERQPADLGIAARGHEIGSDARRDNLICRTLQGQLHARLFLVYDLAHALCAREIALRHDLREQIEETRQILTQHLCAQLETRQERVRLACTCIGDNVRAETARVEAAEHGELGVAVPRGIDCAEHLREEVRIRQICLCNRRHWKVEIQVDNAVRLKIGVQNLRPRAVTHFKRQTLRVRTDVGACENRNRRECLLRVRLLLRRLERRTGVHNRSDLIGAHRRLFLREDLLLCRLTLLSERPARGERHECLMRILEEGLPNHLLEIAVRQPLLQFGKHILIAQIVLGRAIVEPRLHHANPVDESLRRGAKVRLAQTELERIERCLYECVIETAVREFPQGLLDDAHEFIRARRLRFAHDDAEQRLQDVTLIVRVHVTPKPRVDECLTQRCALHPEQRVIEDLQCHHALAVGRVADDPVQREEAVLLERLLRPDGIEMLRFDLPRKRLLTVDA